MQCPQSLQLERKHQEAIATLDAAVKKLYERIGICPKDEFKILSLYLDAAWYAVERVQSELAQHIEEHGCLTGELAAHVWQSGQLNNRGASGAL